MESMRPVADEAVSAPLRAPEGFVTGLQEADIHLAPGWVPNRRPMYLGVSSVPLPGQSARPQWQREVARGTNEAAGDAASPQPPAGSAAQGSQAGTRGVAGSVAGGPGVSRGACDACDTGCGFGAFPSCGMAACQRALTARVGQHRGCAGVDVHIRKLDTPSKLHWRLLASTRVQASAEAIWSVLTDYEKLQDVVPLVVVSELQQPLCGGAGDNGAGVPAPAGGRRRLRRVRQVGAKRLPYVQLHTEVVLDVLEKPGDGADPWELQFKHHRSDFDMLQVCPLACCGIHAQARCDLLPALR
jgi:hypothetical protein